MNFAAPGISRGRWKAAGALSAAFCLAIAGRCSAQAPAASPAAPVEIYLPPVPPLLNAARPAASAAGTRPAPAALAPYVAESFYAPLSTRFAKNEIGDDLAFRLETYRSTRNTLLAELRARFDTLKDTDPETRRSTLEAFSKEQTPRIAALESEAEAIRSDLCRRGSSAVEYNRWQRAMLAAQEGSLTHADRLKIVEMGAFFREGLSPAQRRLLREIAVKWTDEQSPPAANQQPGYLLYLSPETSRVWVSTAMPQELTNLIRAYTKEKTNLEGELIKACYSMSLSPTPEDRTAILKALGKAQAPMLDSLESQADQIRIGLAALNDPARAPDMPTMPEDLVDRIAAHRREALALNKALLARSDEVVKSLPGADSATIEEKKLQAITAFTQENAARYAALAQGGESIQNDVAKLPGTNATSADALLAKNSESLRKLQTYWDYRQYQVAVLQPGLSPEQRRLLFAGALEKLALPLPGSDLTGPSP